MSFTAIPGVSPYRVPVAPPGINFGEDHHLVGFTWPYINSKGKQYNTTMTPRGWVCDRMGFNFHGKCKHINMVHERIIS
jgi:hypothetical protein